jgi:hypothetical protein
MKALKTLLFGLLLGLPVVMPFEKATAQIQGFNSNPALSAGGSISTAGTTIRGFQSSTAAPGQSNALAGQTFGTGNLGAGAAGAGTFGAGTSAGGGTFGAVSPGFTQTQPVSPAQPGFALAPTPRTVAPGFAFGQSAGQLAPRAGQIGLNTPQFGGGTIRTGTANSGNRNRNEGNRQTLGNQAVRLEDNPSRIRGDDAGTKVFAQEDRKRNRNTNGVRLEDNPSKIRGDDVGRKVLVGEDKREDKNAGALRPEDNLSKIRGDDVGKKFAVQEDKPKRAARKVADAEAGKAKKAERTDKAQKDAFGKKQAGSDNVFRFDNRAGMSESFSTAVADRDMQVRSAEEPTKILHIDRMVGLSETFIGNDTHTRGIQGAGRPWDIDSGKVELLSDGKLEVDVSGLVLSDEKNNPLTEFQAVVSCLGEDGTGQLVSSSPFAADGAGNASMEETLEIPSPCIAPMFFITNSQGQWIATTGQ